MKKSGKFLVCIISFLFCNVIIQAQDCSFIAPPVPENKLWLITDISSLPDNFMTASVSETGVEIIWYDSETKDNIIPADENFSFTPDRVALQEEVDTLQNPNNGYVKSYWITQTDDAGCESEPVEVTLTFTNNCPYHAPEVVGEEVCVGEALSDISARVPSSTTVTVDEWKWYDEAMNPITNNSDTYTHGVDNMTAQTTVFYVSYIVTERISGNQCETPTTEVSVIVNPLPGITISAPPIICFDAGDQVFSRTVDYHNNGPGTGVWALDGASTGINSSGVFDPTFNGETTDTYEISYTYTDGKGCENTETQDINVQFTPAPTPAGHYSMIAANETVEVEATSLETGADVKWYETLTSTLEVSTDNPYQILSIPGDIETTESRYATQTVNGCESERIEASIIIMGCPVPAPNVTVESPICIYEDTPPILAEIGSEWLGEEIRPTGVAPEFRFYDSETGSTPIETNTTGEYVPDINKSTTAEYTFWVSEYNDNVVPQGCEGPRTAVTIKVIGEITTPYASTKYKYMCEGGAIPILESDMSTTKWYSDETILSLVGTGYDYTPDRSLLGVGENKFYMLNFSTVGTKTCYSDTASVTLYVTDNCSDTSAPYFHETLGEFIDSAETLLASAEEELKTLRLYQSGAIAFLENEKTAAQEVYDDSYASQTEIDAAVEQLKQAITDFHAMEITAISEVNNMPFILYPNPARNYITVSQVNSNNAISHIIIKNPLHVPEIETTKTRIDISALPPGSYICEIYTSEGVWQKLLVVE